MTTIHCYKTACDHQSSIINKIVVVKCNSEKKNKYRQCLLVKFVSKLPDVKSNKTHHTAYPEDLRLITWPFLSPCKAKMYEMPFIFLLSFLFAFPHELYYQTLEWFKMATATSVLPFFSTFSYFQRTWFKLKGPEKEMVAVHPF